MTSLYDEHIELILELYHMSNGLTFGIFNTIFAKYLPLSGFDSNLTFGKFQGNRFRIDGEIGENYTIPVNCVFEHILLLSGLMGKQQPVI